MTDNTPSVTQSFLYDEFGNALGIWGTGDSKYRYTGQEWDGGTMSAYNLRAREYYPYLGRFMQNDPIGDKGGSFNWYTYVANNPINSIDPSGLQTCKPQQPLNTGCYEDRDRCLEKAQNRLHRCLVGSSLGLAGVEIGLAAACYFGCSAGGVKAVWECMETTNALIWTPLMAMAFTTCGAIYYKDAKDCYSKYPSK